MWSFNLIGVKKMKHLYSNFTAMRSVSSAVWCAVFGCGVMAVLTAGALLTGMRKHHHFTYIPVLNVILMTSLQQTQTRG